MEHVLKYIHPDNKDKKFIDWRLPEYRKELFIRELNWRLVSGADLDNFCWNNAYSNTLHSPSKRPMTKKEKLWFSYLYGVTYHGHMSWVFFNYYPDPTKLDLGELEKWNKETLSRQIWETDTRWNKGFIVSMWGSFLDWVNREGKGDIEEAFDKFLDEDETVSFNQIDKQIRSFHRFGRMSSWLTCQGLKEMCDLPINPGTADSWNPSNHSNWNGMCTYLCREDMTVGDPPYAGYSPTAQDRQMFKKQEQEIMAIAQERVGQKKYLSFFTLESQICQFKKLLIGHEYPGQGVGEATRRYHRMKENWPEVNFQAFVDAVENDVTFPHLRWRLDSGVLRNLLKTTGQPIHMDNLYPDLPDMYKELNLNPDALIPPVDEKLISRSSARYADKLYPELKDPEPFFLE